VKEVLFAKFEILQASYHCGIGDFPAICKNDRTDYLNGSPQENGRGIGHA